jgi:hypothetical protein
MMLMYSIDSHSLQDPSGGLLSVLFRSKAVQMLLKQVQSLKFIHLCSLFVALYDRVILKECLEKSNTGKCERCGESAQEIFERLKGLLPKRKKG